MKNKSLSLVFPLFLLASCSISFSNESHEQGKGDGSDNEGTTIEYYSGDSFETSSYTSYTILTENTSAEEKCFSEAKDYLSYMTFDDTIFSGVSEEDRLVISEDKTDYVSLDQGGLRVGSLIHNVDGCITFNFSSSVVISAVSIEARPRAALKLGATITEYIDNPVSLNVNGGKYITIESSFDSIEDVTSTECRYLLGKTSSSLKINVNGERAIIDAITIYC